MILAPLPSTFDATREALHAVAEHVLAAARYAATGRIGLRADGRGFATPPYAETSTEVAERHLAVDGDELVVHRDGAPVATARLTTLREAAGVAGIAPGGPSAVYHLTTECVADAPLAVDPDASRALGAWFAFADRALAELRGLVDAARDAPSEVQLWPEHFDLAVDLGPEGARANYGASPGDAAIAEPYLYVGPWSEVMPDRFWNASSFTGAVLLYSHLRDAADPLSVAVSFFERGHLLTTEGR